MKRLTFTALVAVVAVGGAYADYQAEKESVNPDAFVFDCTTLNAPTYQSNIGSGGTLYIENTDTPIPKGPLNPYDRHYEPH